MAFSLVTCTNCFKNFLKDNRHINENLKLGHNFFCSSKCQYSSKDKRKELSCNNKGCRNKFKRAPCDISLHNFCSGSCAAIFNNSKRGGLPKPKIRLTKKEKIAIKHAGSALGGKNRWLNYQSQYNKESIVLEIQEFVNKNSRLPVKRELNKFYRPARFYFSTWNNAIEAAGFDPNPVLFANHQMAKDGHTCDSLAEKLIDDYLFERGVVHERTIPYPGGIYTADFKIGDKLIEYFGLAGEHKRYDELRLIKQKLVKKLKLNLIEIYPKDLYPKNHLDQILGIV